MTPPSIFSSAGWELLIMKTMIGLNGPPGIGKTWLGLQLLRVIDGNRRILGLRELIWMEFQPIIHWTGDYADFKSHVFEDGESGRQKMIDFADGKRAIDIHYWDRQYIESAIFRDTDIIIHDSMRKREEQAWFKEHTNLITIVMSPTHYSVGCLYHGDNGICLPPWGGFRVQNSDQALAKFKDFWRQRSESNANANSPIEFPAQDGLTVFMG